MVERTVSVNELAERYQVDPHTVLGWIRSGELRALNVGRRPGKKKPRWRITPEAIASFELTRASSPPPPPKTRRRKQQDDEINFY